MNREPLSWRQLVERLQDEYSRLEPAENAWLTARLKRIADVQQQMHRIFLQAGGAQACRDCAGNCCGCGKNHLTLVNLLGYLAAGETVPEPDFARTCPFLGAAGCRHEVQRRPFNCVTFLCEEVEARLEPEAGHAFYLLEKELRALYAEFDRRYAGSSLCGIFIRAESLGGRPFLGPPKTI